MEFIVQTVKNLNIHIERESFALIQNSWNDNKLKTQYSLYYLGTPSKREQTFIGTVKILKLDQEPDLLHTITKNFKRLPDDFASLGQSLDYYQRISELPEPTSYQLLKSLNDVIDTPSLQKKFERQYGWEKSIYREFDEPQIFTDLATSLLRKKFDNLAGDKLSFKFHVKDSETAIEFTFGNWTPNQTNNNLLTNRIITIIGRNGSGKSTLLSRLSRVAYASEDDRKNPALTRLGTIYPSNIGFPRIITISYSPFDSFKVPGVNSELFQDDANNISSAEAASIHKQERNQIAHDIASGSGRFIFCGLRDIAQEVLNSDDSNNESTDTLSFDRENRTSPKPVELMADEFERNLKKITLQQDIALLDEALFHIESENAFGYDEALLSASALLKSDIKKSFMSWSTGHKIVMQIIASLLAHTTQSSLVLIDEPETHLHPPLLAALMHSIRNILDRKNAFSIIATHSPIILQETLSRNVNIISRDNCSISIKPPTIETFGESIGTLTTEVFELNSRTTDFYKTLREISETYENIEEIESLFTPRGMSSQARAFVIGCLAQKRAR